MLTDRVTKKDHGRLWKEGGDTREKGDVAAERRKREISSEDSPWSPCCLEPWPNTEGNVVDMSPGFLVRRPFVCPITSSYNDNWESREPRAHGHSPHCLGFPTWLHKKSKKRKAAALEEEVIDAGDEL